MERADLERMQNEGHANNVWITTGQLGAPMASADLQLPNGTHTARLDKIERRILAIEAALRDAGLLPAPKE